MGKITNIYPYFRPAGILFTIQMPICSIQQQWQKKQIIEFQNIDYHDYRLIKGTS